MNNPIPRLRTRHIGRVLHLNSLLSQQEEQLDMLYRQLGQSVYERRDEAAHAFRVLSAQIDTGRQNLRALRERLAFAKGMQICQVCGTEQNCNHLYCARCGHCLCHDTAENSAQPESRDAQNASTQPADHSAEDKPPSPSVSCCHKNEANGHYFRGDRDPLLHRDEAARRQMADDRKDLPRRAYEPRSRGLDDSQRAEETGGRKLPEQETPKATSAEIAPDSTPPET